MVYGGEHDCRICFQPIHVIGDGLVELIAVGCLDDVVHVTDILRREDACEIARIANGLYLIESGEGTDHGIGRFEVLSLNKRVQVLVIPLIGGPHLMPKRVSNMATMLNAMQQNRCLDAIEVTETIRGRNAIQR